jgi:hypothetical protein
MRPRVAGVGGRAISTMIESNGLGDMNRFYLRWQMTGMEHHLAWIPGDFEEHASGPFESE